MLSNGMGAAHSYIRKGLREQPFCLITGREACYVTVLGLWPSTLSGNGPAAHYLSPGPKGPLLGKGLRPLP